MSIEICNGCDKLVDTDFDSEVYVNNIPFCFICREE